MTATPEQTEAARRGAFSSRRVFILAAIGSAVGLGNIWRFPYVAYENGGGAFILPYLIALLTAGIPFLFLDYALGHRNRGSAPLSFARLRKGTEFLGWWQVGICAIIAIYYAAIIGWSMRYMFFSVDKAWGSDPEKFFGGEFLSAADPSAGVTFDFVPGILVPLLVVWVVVIAIMALGVQKGVGATSVIFIPVLLLAFVALVVQALLLPGATEGLNALFTPNWSALKDTAVWAAAFGQIFFSLSIGFGIMITYSSYVGRRTDMTGSGLVVGFANSGFELLCGIGVFSALGFMAQASGVQVGDVASGGIGLAFIAFPAIISQAPAGGLIGVLFFASLILAGLTSLVSILEVVISAVRDKFEMSRVGATAVVALPIAVVSVLLFSTTSALTVLDIMDNFINKFGILLVAVVSMLVIAWALRALPALARHLNRYGSIPVRGWWVALISVVTPAVLALILVKELRDTAAETYGGYPDWMVAVFGWGVAAAVVVVGVLVTLVRWRPDTPLTVPEDETDPTALEVAR
ncbi:transporter [Intrasporangium chromatireducens Q5-1]|uniref:Transporter n=1 Tax=Intrasporangium chromatireducens Q5-1 TaxID=584657 RepID=W9GM13_9MICO|nr:sodium-dependent transporter [Intrasporangium chromatireducens]EWT04934.1 transporter [Intrasporangium chromatireducens Q5-1]